jgi:biopolymer transport protein ExbD/biopolymer transport protein TolR
MQVGAGSRLRVQPAMNVTPLVDVVLVLLIIFMVITPMMVKQFHVHVPKQPKPDAEEADEADGPVPIVVAARADGTIWINKEQVVAGDLAQRLERTLASRADRLVFFDADEELAYGRAMEILDVARGGGAANIAVLTEPLPR